MLERLRADAAVEYVAIDHRRFPHATNPNDSLFANQWYLKNTEVSAVDAITAWDTERGSTGMRRTAMATATRRAIARGRVPGGAVAPRCASPRKHLAPAAGRRRPSSPGAVRWSPASCSRRCPAPRASAPARGVQRAALPPEPRSPPRTKLPSPQEPGPQSAGSPDATSPPPIPPRTRPWRALPTRIARGADGAAARSPRWRGRARPPTRPAERNPPGPAPAPWAPPSSAPPSSAPPSSAEPPRAHPRTTGDARDRSLGVAIRAGAR
jgi:hypothetical protein